MQEEVDDSCSAIQIRTIRIVGFDGKKDVNSNLSLTEIDAFKSLMQFGIAKSLAVLADKGSIARLIAREQHPDIPPVITCYGYYWYSMLNPEWLRNYNSSGDQLFARLQKQLLSTINDFGHKGTNISNQNGDNSNTNPDFNSQPKTVTKEEISKFIHDYYGKCWSDQPHPVAEVDSNNPNNIAIIKFRVTKAGELENVPRSVRKPLSEQNEQIISKGIDAIKKCTPIILPQQFYPFYNEWHEITVRFHEYGGLY